MLRAAAIYLILFLLLRLSGKRTLAQITTFDFVLLLIVGEAVGQALLGDDFSVTNAAVVVATLVGLDLPLSGIQERWPNLGRLIEGLPAVLVSDGEVLQDRMRRARVDEADILEFARTTQGLERMADVRYAALERDGSISIIPQHIPNGD